MRYYAAALLHRVINPVCLIRTRADVRIYCNRIHPCFIVKPLRVRRKRHGIRPVPIVRKVYLYLLGQLVHRIIHIRRPYGEYNVRPVAEHHFSIFIYTCCKALSGNIHYVGYYVLRTFKDYRFLYPAWQHRVFHVHALSSRVFIRKLGRVSRKHKLVHALKARAVRLLHPGRYFRVQFPGLHAL